METYQSEWGQENEDTQRGRYLLFSIDKEVYGMEIRLVTEIIGMQPLSTLPETPEYIKGVINLRGKIIPAIDLRSRFKKPETAYTDRTCIIVVETSDLTAGLIVDEVAEVVSIEDKDIAPPPKMRIGESSRYINGIGKLKGEVKLLLDCEKLFTEEETRQIEAVKEGEMQK